MMKRYLKIFGKILLVILLFLCVQTCRACFWYPYRIEKYINSELENVDFAIVDIPKAKEFDKYKVNEAFVKIRVLGHNETTRSGNSPYKISLSIWGKDNRYRSACINKFKILSNGEKKYILQNNLLPIKLKFRLFTNSKKTVITSFLIPELIALDFKNKEEIEIITELEVVTEEKSEKKEVRYKFIPLLEEGHAGIFYGL